MHNAVCSEQLQKNLFSCKIICADCGGYYGAKVWNSTSKYRKRVWQCNDKYTGATVCSTPHVCEDILKEKFIRAANILLSRAESVVKDCDTLVSTLRDFHTLDSEIERLDRETETLSEANRAFLEQNASTEQDQDAYLEKYGRLTAEFDSLTAQRDLLQSTKQQRIAQAEEISRLKTELLRQHGPLMEFDDMLWITCLDHVTVFPDGSLAFQFKIGESTKAELFAHSREPAITFKIDRMKFNMACIRRFSGVTHISVMKSTTIYGSCRCPMKSRSTE